MSFIPNANTQIFTKEVHRLMNEGKIHSFKEVADHLEWDATAISNVMNNRRNIPFEKFKKFTDLYKIENPAEAGFKDKYISLLEQRAEAAEQLDSYVRQLLLTNTNLQNRLEVLEKSLVQLQTSLTVASAMMVAHQEVVLEKIVGDGKTHKEMQRIRKKAVEFLTSFSEKGIGADMGIVPAEMLL